MCIFSIKNLCNTESRSKDILQEDYRRLIKSYITARNIIENEINLILPQIPRKQKCGIITTLVSSFIGLTYEGISSFLHHKQNKALHKTVRAMDSKTTIQHNKLMQLENSMLMYGIYKQKHWRSSLTLYTIYTTQHPCMTDYL